MIYVINDSTNERLYERTYVSWLLLAESTLAAIRMKKRREKWGRERKIEIEIEI